MAGGREASAAAALWAGWRRERMRASSALHDQIGQSLTAAGLELDLLGMDLARTAPALAVRISQIQATLEGAFTHLRALSRELNPEPARRYGVREAVAGLAARIELESAARVEVTWQCEPEQTDPAPFDAVAVALEMLAASAPGRPLFLCVSAGAWELGPGAEQFSGACWRELAELAGCGSSVTADARRCTLSFHARTGEGAAG